MDATTSLKTFLEPADVALLEANAVYRNPRTGVEEPCLRDIILIRLLYRCGARVGEAVSIAVEDLNLQRREVRVIRQKERIRLYCPDCGNRLSRSANFCPGCGHQVTAAERRIQEERRQRLLPLDPDTVELLRQYIAEGGPVMKNGRLMLLGIGTTRAWQIVRDASRRAGLGELINPETGRRRGVSPHRLRDAFATHAASVDGSQEGLRLLQEQLGHKSIEQTARYVKVAQGKHRDWFERLWRDGASSQEP
jgi:integrase/recombinase XerD